VALIDEVEKIFNTGTSDTSGVTQSMLSQLLWWLAEHQERVFVVMTTNQRKVIPPEMYRERRVDKVMVFPGLKESSALKFAKGVAGTFNKVKIPDATLGKSIKTLYASSADEGGYVSQAALTEMVQRLVKDHI
jgi:SpoVK/Ycf46/Vps4 family AAA+-type ATPase